MYEGIIIDHTRRTLAAMVTALDDAADAVVNALDKNGLLEETVFVFFSDNGGPLGNIGNGQVWALYNTIFPWKVLLIAKNIV